MNRTARFGQSGHPIRVVFASDPTTLAVGDSVLVHRRGVSSYLAPGIHFARFRWGEYTTRTAVWVRHMPVHQMIVRRGDEIPARIYAHLFYGFAHHPSVKTGPFDTPVSLGVGGRLVRVLSDDDRYDPMKWRVSVLGYAERSGTASALGLLLEHGRDAHVSNRPPPPCVVHLRPGLRLTGGGTLIRIQPRQRRSLSCIEWWSVDLFVNDVGQVVGVNVNLGAP